MKITKITIEGAWLDSEMDDVHLEALATKLAGECHAEVVAMSYEQSTISVDNDDPKWFEKARALLGVSELTDPPAPIVEPEEHDEEVDDQPF